MLASETLKAFRDGTLELHCPEMVLRQRAAESPAEYKGAGIIRQDREQQLEFVLLENGPMPSPATGLTRMLANVGSVGQLVPEDRYYSLQAKDLRGWTWTADRLPICHDSGPGGAVVCGKPWVLDHTEEATETASSLLLEIGGNVEIPCAKFTESTIRAGDGEQRISRRNRAEFQAGEWRVSTTREDGFLLLEAMSPRRTADHIETRMLEALQYVTGRTLVWRFVGKTEELRSTTSLRSEPVKLSLQQMLPPIEHHRHDLGGQATWTLFDLYLRHIMRFRGDNRFQMHPLSAWLHYVRSASAASIFTQGLALGVAVEGVLEGEFRDVGSPPKGYIDAVGDLTRHVDSWSGDLNVKKRTLGAINAMRSARAKDRLLALAAEAIVQKRDVDAWDRIRNRGAHARPPESSERQEWIDDCHKTSVLLHHLLFRAIGYQGLYTDYGAANWPAKNYAASPDTPAAEAK